jgi:large subunit ribosomal protein LP0
MSKELKRAPKKVKVYENMHKFLAKYHTVVLADIKDMPANNIHKMRKLLRALDSEVLCGKSSVMDLAITQYLSGKSKLPEFHTKDKLEELATQITNRQLCLIFTNKEVGDITKISDQFKLEKQAKVNSISPIEVTLPAGPTGMDASQIEYFQNLRIPTKVIKNQLENTTSTKILSVGSKITLSEINLMNKFNIKPFRHRIAVTNIYIRGKLYDEGILNLNSEVMEKALQKGINNIASFGLATGIANKASAVHSIANGFRNILGLSLGCDVEIKQAKGLKASSTTTAAPAAPAKKEEPKKEEKKKVVEEKKKVVEEDDEDVGFGGLF